MAVDPVRAIQTFNAKRDPERLRLKYRAMRASPFAFLRGSCHLFYQRLPRSGIFKSAPATWVCGDLHLENFGSYRGDNRLTYFDINDFDESALAPLSWDLVRLLTSIHVGAETLSINASGAHKLCQRLVDAYVSALADGKTYWIERDTATGLVGKLLTGLRDRRRSDFLADRTVGKGKKRRLLVDGKKALPASQVQHDRVEEFMRLFAEHEPVPDFYRVLDVARRIAGTGSLGVDRYVILVAGKGSPDQNYLLDLKQALPSSLVPRLPMAQPACGSDAERAVTIQRRAQAIPMALLRPVRFVGEPYVLRSLQPSEDRVQLDRTRGNMKVLEPLVATMGQLVAWSHMRGAGKDDSAIPDELIEFAKGRIWQEQLLSAAHACAGQVRKDAAEFDTAFDDGLLNV